MAKSKDKFVLYLDIMGFKERVKKVETDELKVQLQSFMTRDNKLKPLLKDAKKETILINKAQFSDSIVLVTTSDTLDDLNRICKAAVILMQNALKTGFALRGAMTKGEMVFDTENQLFFGKALVDAYLLEEELCYYGIVFHESMEDDVIKVEQSKQYYILNEDSKSKRYIPIEDIEVPLKKGKSKHYHIAWHTLTEILKKGNIKEEALGWLKEMRKTVSGNPRVYLDNTIEIIQKKQSTSTIKPQAELSFAIGEDGTVK